jgi:hypothetical protein
MTSHHPGRPQRRRLGVTLRRWHRRLGVAACVFVLWLACSGIVLHHSAVLGLDNLRLSAPWLTQWYGLKETSPAAGYAAGAHWLAGNDEAAILDGALLTPPLAQAQGLVEAGGLLAVATPHSLVLLTPQGQRVDELKGAQLPMETISAIGGAEGRIVIRGLRSTYVSADGESWSAYDGAAQWSRLQHLSAAQSALAAPLLRPSLNAVRVLSDAHSGRLFGSWGPLVIDLAAGAFIVLAASGIWMFLRQRQRR